MNAAALSASTQAIRKAFADSVAAKRTFLREHAAAGAAVAERLVGRVGPPERGAGGSGGMALWQPPINRAKNTQHPLRPVMVRARTAWHRSADS